MAIMLSYLISCPPTRPLADRLDFVVTCQLFVIMNKCFIVIVAIAFVDSDTIGIADAMSLSVSPTPCLTTFARYNCPTDHGHMFSIVWPDD